MAIRLFIYSSSPMVASSLALLFEKDNRFVLSSGSDESLLDNGLKNGRFDLVLLYSPTVDAGIIDMIRHINDSGVNKHHAALAVLGELEEDTELYSLIANGVDGYFIETMNIDDMFFYLANISKGIPYYSMRVLAPLIKRTITENALVRESSTSSLFDSLTPRERLILGKLCQGLTTQDICHELYLSQGTIKNHLRSIYHKLGVANKTQAVLVALGRGWNATKEERCSS